MVGVGNIVGEAWKGLAERYNKTKGQRQVINDALNGYSDDALTNVQQKVEVEIEEQQSARQQYIDGVATPAE